MRAMHPFHRTELLVGGGGFDRLTAGRACVIGLGGVGSYAAEALVRSGVGHVTMVDFDKVCVTNVNRQLHATRKTVRKSKVALMVERAEAINPKAEIVGHELFYSPETSDVILGTPDQPAFDIVLDCIDNMTTKVHLIETCVARGVPVIAAMGAGGRLDPTRVQVSDIADTHTDPFARIVRDLLRQRGIDNGVQCVWSDEPPNDLDAAAQEGFVCICPDKANSPHGCDNRLQVQGSVAWMPSIFGLTMAAVAAGQLMERSVIAPRPAPKFERMAPARQKLSRARKQELLAEGGFRRMESDETAPVATE